MTLSIDLPPKILSKMRLNKNFANIYTPFHEMEDLEIELTDRRRQRVERRALDKPVEWD